MAGVLPVCMRTNPYDCMTFGWNSFSWDYFGWKYKIHFVQRHLWLPFKLWQKERRKEKNSTIKSVLCWGKVSLECFEREPFKWNAWSGWFKWWIIVSVWLFSLHILSLISFSLCGRKKKQNECVHHFRKMKSTFEFHFCSKVRIYTISCTWFLFANGNFHILFKIIVKIQQWFSNNKIKAQAKPASHTGSTLRTKAIKKERRLFNNSSTINIHH